MISVKQPVSCSIYVSLAQAHYKPLREKIGAGSRVPVKPIADVILFAKDRLLLGCYKRMASAGLIANFYGTPLKQDWVNPFPHNSKPNLTVV